MWTLSIAFSLFDWLLKKVYKISLVKKLTVWELKVELQSLYELKFYRSVFLLVIKNEPISMQETDSCKITYCRQRDATLMIDVLGHFPLDQKFWFEISGIPCDEWNGNCRLVGWTNPSQTITFQVSSENTNSKTRENMKMTYSVLLLLELFKDSEVEYDRILAEMTIFFQRSQLLHAKKFKSSLRVLWKYYTTVVSRWIQESFSNGKINLHRRGSRILKWGVNFCNNVIEPKPGWGVWGLCISMIQKKEGGWKFTHFTSPGSTPAASCLFARPCQQEEYHLVTDPGELWSHKRLNKS